MKVKLLTHAANEYGVYPAGSIADLPEAMAKAIVEGGYGTFVDIQPDTVVIEYKTEPEQPIEIKAKRRGRKRDTANNG